MPGEFKHTSVSCPDEPRQPIENRIAKDFESRYRPRHAASLQQRIVVKINLAD